MAYNPIANLEIDGGSFWTETLSQKFRDNIKDHVHGESDVGIGLTSYSVGDYLLHEPNSSMRTTVSTTYVKLKETKLRRGGTLRITFALGLSTTGSGTTAYGQIYRNGVAVGTERTTITAPGFATFSEDISGWAVGDLVQVYGKHSSGSISTRVQDLTIYSDGEGNHKDY